MINYTHVLVGVGTMVLMYLGKLLKDKLFPDKSLTGSTPTIVVNVNIHSADKVTVDTETKKELLKG